ncbi:histidine kinase [Paraburkholderia caballeronis]|uniref:sensor histidine kinase n=1 Tax=Paraburkholderia caballeronis TaxID=416943 RepID=UPI001065FF4F|nr:HAMP domain-containing sensor histidine kinase [Paraburkholderia caballeronis]TDV39631.1 histidine kinase [Paraburkholderia caballeronis]
MATTSPSRSERIAHLCSVVALFMRDHVLSRVSHDLRSPLNAIHSWAYVLERKIDSADPAAQRAIDGIRTGVEQQVQLLETIVDTTRNETRQLPVAREPFPADAMINDAIDDARIALADARGVTIDARGMPCGGTIDGDIERCGQALWLMLVFAAEASARHATIALDVAEEASQIRLAVGFTATMQALTDAAVPHRLEAFARTQACQPQETGRAAWVLALCQRVAEAHGGRFEAEPLKDGAPATLTLRLPIRPA